MNNRYDLLYNPRFSVPDFAQIAARWAEASAKSRASLDCYLDVPYGSTDTERMDIFRAQGVSRGLLMFIHGGYWRAQDKAGYSFLADSLCRAGITVAIPNYSLCPKVKVHDIVMQMVQASAWLHRNGSNFGAPAGRLYVCGHSAGGHLTAMMLACLWQVYAQDLPRKVVRAGLSISGVFDLKDIVKTPSINGDVRLTRKSALPVSPALLPAATDAPLYLTVGGNETGGFHTQHSLMLEKWKRVIAEDIDSPGDNHFTILDRLTQPGSKLHDAVIRMMNE